MSSNESGYEYLLLTQVKRQQLTVYLEFARVLDVTVG
jgi:hypothetical protein